MSGLTAKQIAEQTGKTVRWIQARAKKEAWPYTIATGRGGKIPLYAVSTLPEDIQAALLNKEKPAESLPVESPGGINPNLNPNSNRKGTIKTDMSRPTTLDRQAVAAARADLVRAYVEHLNQAGRGSKTAARKGFMAAYNAGQSYPRLFGILGPVSWQTIERWKRSFETANLPALADRRGRPAGTGLLTPQQTEILLSCVLHPNRPLIAEAIRMAKAVMASKGIENGHSERTYRRWLAQWKDRHYHIWVWTREGSKAWNDKCALYIERDYDTIEVGDLVVADGHILNFEIINPWTGKPKRMTLIVWRDMKSSYPLGWEIMPTENTQAIASALRRSILRLGKIPQVAYLDNGKAFGSKFFNSDLTESGLFGLFARLNIKTIFAWPYHGQSKTIERFFRDFAELERWCPTYVGTSIDKKPPRLLRGETLHRKVYEKWTGGQCLTMEQAHRAIAAWFDQYVQRPQSGHLNGRCPAEVFETGRGPGVDPAELTFLMMAQEIRHIRRNGIHFLGRNYYHPELYGRRHQVLIRYDLQAPEEIYVFETDGRFICSAKQTEKIHPAAAILGDDEDREKLRKWIAEKRHQEKLASISARKFLEDEVLPAHRRQLAAAGLLETGQEAPTQDDPAPQLTADDEAKILAEVAEYEKEQQAEARDMWSELEDLGELDRYERLVEAEARGLLIPKRWAAWMKYFEQTPAWKRQADIGYWDQVAAAAAIMYQVQQ